MIVGSQHPHDNSENQSKIASVSGLENRYKAWLLTAQLFKTHSENKDYENAIDLIWHNNIKDMFVFESYRLINWLERMRICGYLDKDSPLRPVCKLQKKVRELRDYLMHEEEYIVAGAGKKPKNYLSEKEWGVLNPSSSISFFDSTVFGRKVDAEVHLGNKLEFFSLFETVTTAFNEAEKAKFFDLSAEIEIENKIMLDNK